MPGITLLGLGPGDPAQLTRQAWEVLASIDEIWLRTAQHPSVKGFPAALKVHSFDQLYEEGQSFEAVYAAIVEKVIALGQRPGGVVYAVPGDPFVAEATGPEIARRCRATGLPLTIVSGLSFLEPAFAALGLDPYPRLTLVDGLELSQAHVPAFPPDMGALVAQIYSPLVAAEVKLTLGAVYADEHPVRLVHAAGTPQEVVEDLPLHAVDRSPHIGLLTALYVPPLGAGTSFEAFQDVIAALRAPDGCPWDREQTHLSLRPHLLEEAYETLAALDGKDPAKMAEEFGDLLLQIVLHAQIASEEGEFGMAEVLKGIHDKIIRRHPHVFGDIELDGVGGVLQNWEKIKADERSSHGEGARSLLEGVPLALPALIQAQQIQERAARVGFDWPEVEGVLDKIAEEIGEVQAAADEQELAAELGDLFFALVNLARWKKIDAESALRAASQRFRQRFAHVEAGARAQNRQLSEMTIDELEALWQAAKSK
ncbi:MAG: nucleoside triphosphate pyrophosphohydrolase [Anaerolineales bacterium]|nr:nucleoside triphosphate pyrophosphohydrolase [Anaerolineales bacterium]